MKPDLENRTRGGWDAISSFSLQSLRISRSQGDRSSNGPNSVKGLHPMNNPSLSYLRSLCDDYLDPSEYICGGGFTQFHVDHVVSIRDKAKTALNFYNKKKRKNFDLEKVVKLNRFFGTHSCLTFWAQRNENAERHLFRAVVYQGNVLLCEIKDGDDEITIPACHDEDEPRKSQKIEGNDFRWEWLQNVPKGCDVSSEDDSEDDSENEKCYPAVRLGGVDVAGSAAGRLE